MTQPPSWLMTDSAARTPRRRAWRPPRALFVCTGNICRSAFAACYFTSSPRTRGVETASAGTAAVVGHGMDEPFARLAEDLGIDPREHRAQQLTGRLLKDSDILLVFSAEHHEWVFTNQPEVADRVLSLGQVGAVLASLPQRVVVPWWALTETVLARRPTPQPDDWIDDPYGRDRRAFRRIARMIIADLDLLTARVSWRTTRTATSRPSRPSPSTPSPANEPPPMRP